MFSGFLILLPMDGFSLMKYDFVCSRKFSYVLLEAALIIRNNCVKDLIRMVHRRRLPVCYSHLFHMIRIIHFHIKTSAASEA